MVHKVEGNDDGGATYHWADDAYPANQVSLRSVGWDNYVIIDVETGRNIAEMDWRSTHTMLHEQAIYQHDGDQYQVEKLDYENHKAFVRKVVPDYFTDAMTYTRIAIIEEDDQHLGSHVEVAHGEVSLVDRVVGYKKSVQHPRECRLWGCPTPGCPDAYNKRLVDLSQRPARPARPVETRLSGRVKRAFQSDAYRCNGWSDVRSPRPRLCGERWPPRG